MNNKEKYVIGSYFYNEKSEWGWKYAFTLNKELTIAQFIELLKVIERELNKFNNGTLLL